MTEQTISFDNQNSKIYGIKHTSSISNNLNGIWIVFLHGWSGYRAGPHDIFVKMARKLTKLGFTCVRFDFRGRGYSGEKQFKASFISMSSDIHAVVKECHDNAEVRKIVLIGICSGARLGIHFIKNTSLKIDHLVEISSPPLDETVINVKMELSKARFIGSGYLSKIFTIQTYKKLINKEIDYMRIFKIVINPFRKSIAKSSTQKAKTFQRWSPGDFPVFRGTVLSIHAEMDPETELATSQISTMLSQYHIQLKTEIVEGANHSFYSTNSENIVFDKIEKWLLKIYARQ